jgi:hypothetical protein
MMFCLISSNSPRVFKTDMKVFLRLGSLTVALILALTLGPARAGLPGIPGVPGVPSVNQAAKDVVSKELVKKMGDEFFLQQPLRLSADAEYPIVATLPGGQFRPVSQDVVKNLYARSHDGHVLFPAGDYAISVFNYCMLAHVHVPTRNKFRLTPIQGQWADIASALFARTSYGYNPHDVQILTWSLLAGMKYQELSPASRHLVDTVLPEFKSRMQESFYEKLQRYWGQISSNVPGVPSFDAALGQMGDVGKAIIQVRDIRNELIANAADYDSIMRDFATIGVARVPGDLAPTPWSIVKPGVYARMLDKGGYLNPGVLEIRVTRQAVSANGVQLASLDNRALPHAVAIGFGGTDLGSTGWAGYPGGAVQALGWNPKPGDDPGVPPGGNAPNPGSGPNGDNGSPNPGQAPNNGNSPNPGQSPDDNGGGGGGNNGGQNGNSSNSNDDNGDASSSCDPPDNVFGVDKGLLVSDSSGGMNIGRGKGHGWVCLLLRPFISLAPLGWPARPGGQVDDGSASYSLFGHAQPGHVVIVAHYTYATTSTITQLYVKKHITAIIDYGSVSPFCPELTQTLAGNGPKNGWLSGAELENRLCIAGMQGQAIHINAWVVDGDFTGSQAQAHQVDPSNFLYEDQWGHM